MFGYLTLIKLMMWKCSTLYQRYQDELLDIDKSYFHEMLNLKRSRWISLI